ncbi:hypothetical protein PWG15_07130 [Ensifer adhaerens]|uniref:hypothetical protein n=1 Tax=Ensifer adhaerens TaxID=106592 RepID=UPI0023A9E418|nr:hypothetical protein [Ensifer adhaerens]WDZ78256.1 hypothetical protein PWG15_07130 [Ensifer adhaerens]
MSDEASPLRQAIGRLGTPIVHLSMHGNDQGICLTDGTMIDWEYLLGILTPLNNGLEWGVFVTLSTCGGAAAARMSMYTEEHRKPLYATLGSTENIPWDDALVAYTVFYHNLFKLKLPATCVELMRAASGHNSFQFYGGAEQKRAFIEFVNKQRLVEALTRD